jgi:hypothetical protein
MSGKRRVRVNLDALRAVFEIAMAEVNYFLDLETGEVEMVSDEARSDLEEIYALIYDENGNRTVSLAEHLRQRIDLPDWYRDTLIIADLVEQHCGDRFLSIDAAGPHEDYQDLERFIGRGIEPDRLRERFWAAIQGRGAFGRFKDLLARHPDLEQRWFAYKAERVEERMQAWLAYHEIEPVPEQQAAVLATCSIRRV